MQYMADVVENIIRWRMVDNEQMYNRCIAACVVVVYGVLADVVENISRRCMVCVVCTSAA